MRRDTRNNKAERTTTNSGILVVRLLDKVRVINARKGKMPYRGVVVLALGADEKERDRVRPDIAGRRRSVSQAHLRGTILSSSSPRREKTVSSRDEKQLLHCKRLT